MDAIFRAEGAEGVRRALGREAPDWLQALDDPANPRRLLRALELARSGATPPVPGGKEGFRPALVGLRMPRQVVEARIRRRTAAMFEGGLLAEARVLRTRYGRLSATAAGAIGYREAFAVLDGTLEPAEAIEQTVVRTRRLAKRQMTWFRNQACLHWIDLEGDEPPGEVAGKVRAAWERLGATDMAV